MKYRKLKIGASLILLVAIVLSVIGLLSQRLIWNDFWGDLILYAGYALIVFDYIFILKGDYGSIPWYELSRKMPKFDSMKFTNIFRKKEEEFVVPDDWFDTSPRVEEEVKVKLAVEPVPFFGNLNKRKRFGIPLPHSIKRIVAFILLIFSVLTSIPNILNPNSRFILIFTVPFIVLFFDYLSITRYSTVLSSMHMLDNVERIN